MAILAWLVEYCVVLLNLFHRGEPHDGMTPYQRLRGRPWRIEIPHFGECVEFMRRTRHKFQRRWAIGIFLGLKEHTTERIVGTSEGIFVVQSIRRKPGDQRWNADMIKSIMGLPWKPKSDSDKGELPEPIVLEPVNPEVPIVSSAPHVVQYGQRTSTSTY